jgi:microfibrillar-associated protein 1
MPEEERLKEDLERARESRKKERTQHQFMQKYYHKGAFYQASTKKKRRISMPVCLLPLTHLFLG